MMKYRLGDICDIVKGDTGLMKAIPGKYEMVTTGEANKTHNQFQFDTKAAIIPLVSSTGHGHASMKRVKYVEGKFALGNILCAVIPKSENFILAKYLHIYLHWNREELLVSQMKGMANVSLSLNKIADVEVFVPGIKKQKEIVDLEKKLVTKELEAENLLSDQLSQLENLNQAILQEAVQGKLVSQNKKDEPAIELLKRIKAEKLKSGKKEKPLPPIKPEEIPFQIPKNWVWCRLGEICNKVTDGFHNTPKKLKEGRIYISATHIREDGIRWDDCLYVSEKDHKELFNKAYPKKGEILITNRGAGCSTPVIIDIEEEFSFQNAALIGFNQELICNTYVFYFILKSRDEVMKTFVNGGLQPMLSNVVLRTIPIPLPPLSEQKRIVAEIEKQLAKTKQLKEHIITNQQATEQLLKALLHQAFEVEEMEEV